MSLILLGILNSQVSPAAGGSYDLLESTVLTSSASSVTFTGLDAYSDYKHLQIRAVTRTTRASSNDVVLLNFNSDSGSNYAWHSLRGSGSAVSSGAGTSQTYIQLGITQTTDNTANAFGPLVADILDFSSSSKNTTVRSLSGQTVGNTFIDLRSGLWNSTSAVTSIELTQFGTDFVTGSRFSLMGVK